MRFTEPLVDIHCHLIPEIDDGARNWQEATLMARLSAADGIRTVIVTPRQLGVYAHNHGDWIRQRTRELADWLAAEEIELNVAAGAYAYCEEGLADKVRQGEVVTLADHGRHLLLELPPAPFPVLDRVLDELEDAGIVAILAQPERHGVLQRHRHHLERLVERGCLLQLGADSLLGAFGYQARSLAEWLLRERFAHFVASDARGAISRRPLLRQAYDHVADLTDADTANDLFCYHPAAVIAGASIAPLKFAPHRRVQAVWQRWFGVRRAA
jgi:protein-tyrosine phosphatase